MKKIFVLLVAVAMLMLAACGANEEKVFATVEAKDCFGNAGYIELIAGAEKSAVYNFTAVNSDEVE